MHADGVLRDRHQHFGDIGIELEAGRDVDGLVQLDRIGGVVADLRIGQIEAQEVDRLLAAEVDDPHAVPFRELAQEMIVARLVDFVAQDGPRDVEGGGKLFLPSRFRAAAILLTALARIFAAIFLT